MGEGDALGQGHWLLLVPSQHNSLHSGKQAARLSGLWAFTAGGVDSPDSPDSCKRGGWQTLVSGLLLEVGLTFWTLSCYLRWGIHSLDSGLLLEVGKTLDFFMLFEVGYTLSGFWSAAGGGASFLDSVLLLEVRYTFWT